MSDLLTTIAAVEWIVVGLLVCHKLRYWNQRCQALYDDLAREFARNGEDTHG